MNQQEQIGALVEVVEGLASILEELTEHLAIHDRENRWALETLAHRVSYVRRNQLGALSKEALP